MRWWGGAVLALAFAMLATPAMTADGWLRSIGVGEVELGQPVDLTIRVPMFAGIETHRDHVAGGGVYLARGEIPDAATTPIAQGIVAAMPRGALPFTALFVLTFVIAGIFTHHNRRSTRGRLVRVQVVSLLWIALVAIAVKGMLLTTATSVLVVPVAMFAMVPTMVLDRVVGLATGILAALVVTLLGPFDLGVAILMLAQAATAGLVVHERPKHRWKAAFLAGAITTAFTVATYVLLTYLTTYELPSLGDPLTSPVFAAAIGPAIAMVVVVPLIPIYQLLVGEITHGKLVELEDLSNPLLKQIAERSPGTWQHSLMMANMAEIAANAIGANGRLVRVGAYYHDLGKSLTPKYFIENLDRGEPSPHDQLPPEVSCDAIFAHVTEGIAAARRAGLHERIIDFMHMHHGDGVLEYFWGKCQEQGNPNQLAIERFRYPGHPPQSRETAILAICDAVEAASRTLKKPDPASIGALVQRIVYGKLHLGQLDESGLSMGDLRRISDSLRETIRHANHGRIEYPWQKAEQDASASVARPQGTEPRLDSLDRKPRRDTRTSAVAEAPAVHASDHGRVTDGPHAAAEPTPAPRMSAQHPIELGDAERKRPSHPPASHAELAIAQTADVRAHVAPPEDLAIVETAPVTPLDRDPNSASRAGAWRNDDAARTGDEIPTGAQPGAGEDPGAPATPEPVPRPPVVPDALPAKPTTFAGITPPAARKRASTLPPIPSTGSPINSGSVVSPLPTPPNATLIDGSRAPSVVAPLPQPPAPNPAPQAPAIAPVRPAGPPSSTLHGSPGASRTPAVNPPPEAVFTTLREYKPPVSIPVDEAEILDAAHSKAGIPGGTVPMSQPSSPSPSPVRYAGPPARERDDQLENAITNPPPLRHASSSAPGALLRPSRDTDSDQIGRAAPKPVQVPRTHVGHVPARTDPDRDLMATLRDAPDLAATFREDPRDLAGRTDPAMPTFDLPLPADGPVAQAAHPHVHKRPRVDEWQTDTPIKPPTKAELRNLLGQPDPTREQSLDELEALHRAVDAAGSEPALPSRFPRTTEEVHPEDIEAEIAIAPPARQKAPHVIGVAKKKPE